ncbi:hypothetical protein DB32_000381 [Sandaracinus amylolyticus]|uniref:Uncharacterized protein n=1 Tax=Sandaracinus amylolyticus TaxID=927083 RepID=A0A0F6YFX8_9BACT|nr:hypothetical protein DB32_000381 [Sandaracinus amylolyticus]
MRGISRWHRACSGRVAPEEVVVSTLESPPDPTRDEDALRALLHRWLFEHDPVYLLSAMLVLAGLWLVSRDMAEVAALGGLGVGMIAELYALALIGGAAFLWRRHERRAAVMLALLAAIYQCDPTLQVELFSFVGPIGIAASGGWIVLFVVKLVALARALELRVSRSALIVPVIGALGLALLPQLFRGSALELRTSLTMLWLFALGAAALWTSRRIESVRGLDVRGRRALTGTWALWAAGALAHVTYWCAELRVSPGALVAAATLLATRWAPREREVWGIAGAALAGTMLIAPSQTWCVALMVACVLVLRAWRAPDARVELVRAPRPPYRSIDEQDVHELAVGFAPAPQIARRRLLVGALASVYLALWTFDHHVRGLPPHELVLDVALAVLCVIAARRWRAWTPLAPIALTSAHAAVERGWLVAPRGSFEWGAASIALGFALLAAGLAQAARRARGLAPPG